MDTKNKLEIEADTRPIANFRKEKRCCFSPKNFFMLYPLYYFIHFKIEEAFCFLTMIDLQETKILLYIF